MDNKIQGLKKNVVKAVIDDMEFIRVTNLDSNGDIINVIMYMKTNDKYKVVTPNEIPQRIVNKLAIDNTYVRMEEIEIINFLNVLKEIKKLISSQNDFIPLEYLVVDSVIDVNYIVTKSNEEKFYALNSVKVNEFGVIKESSSVSPSELPYVLIDLIEKDKNFNNKTYLVYQNIFAHICREDNKYLILIYEFKEATEEVNQEMVTVKRSFTLIENEGKFILVTDMENELFLEMNDEKFKSISKDFLDNIGLEMLDN